MAQQQGIQDALSGTGSGSLSPSVGTPTEPSGDLGSQSDPGGTAGGGGTAPDTSDVSSFGGLGDLNKGGLAKRKPKVKKMKRGGLASR